MNITFFLYPYMLLPLIVNCLLIPHRISGCQFFGCGEVKNLRRFNIAVETRLFLIIILKVLQTKLVHFKLCGFYVRKNAHLFIIHF